MFKIPNKYCIQARYFGSNDAIDSNGVFSIPLGPLVRNVMASDGMGWEHVSVSLRNRTPNWREMCFIKGLLAASGNFALERLCADERVSTWCDKV